MTATVKRASSRTERYAPWWTASRRRWTHVSRRGGAPKMLKLRCPAGDEILGKSPWSVASARVIACGSPGWLSVTLTHRMGSARVVFWDFDGTLARRRGLWLGAVQDALTAVAPGREVALDQLRAPLSHGFPWHSPEIVVPPRSSEQWWAALRPVFLNAYEAVGVPLDIAEEAADRIAAEFYRVDAWELIPGAVQAIQITGAAGYENVILSNHGPELPQLVEALGVSRWIASTISSAAVGAEKPHPRIFEYALAATQAGPDTWMVGDNPIADISGARQAGIRAILADGIYEDAVGVTVLQAAQQIRSSSSR